MSLKRAVEERLCQSMAYKITVFSKHMEHNSNIVLHLAESDGKGEESLYTRSRLHQGKTAKLPVGRKNKKERPK